MIFVPRVARKDSNTLFLHTMVQGVNKEYFFYKEEYIEKYLDIIEQNNLEDAFGRCPQKHFPKNNLT